MSAKHDPQKFCRGRLHVLVHDGGETAVWLTAPRLLAGGAAGAAAAVPGNRLRPPGTERGNGKIETEVLCALIAGAATVLAAAAEYRSRKSARRAEARAARRATESRLAMDLMYASCSLSLTTAKKLAGQHTNGDVEEAMEAAEAARTAYIGFVRSEAAHNVSKI